MSGYQMSSRFFTPVSESDSESSSSEEEQVQQKATVGTFQFSDDEEETKRVVRSSKEKRYEELTNFIKQIRNHKKIKDMSKMLSGFEDLTRSYSKTKSVIDKEERGTCPKFYLKCLVEVEDFIVECWEDREGRKNMSKNNSKSLATLRQKLRKYNKEFEKEITEYRENPDVEVESDDDADRDSESDDDGDDDDLMAESFKKASVPSEPKSVKFQKKDEDSDEDSYWGSSTDEESESSSDDEKYGDNMAARFLKRKGTSDKDTEKSVEKKKKEKKEKKDSRRKDDDDEGEWEEVKDGVRIYVKPKMFAKDAEINHQSVLKKLNEILSARGKKGTDRSEQIELLQELHTIADANNLGPAISVKIMFAIIASIFDYNPNIATCMKSEMWAKCLDNINTILTLIETPEIHIGEQILEDSEVFVAPPYRVRGCMLSVVERMDEEYIKMLQGCDAHSLEYVERLKDEKIVCTIIERLQTFLEKTGSSGELCRVYLRRIEHLYYKFDQTVFQPTTDDNKENSLTIMGRLSKFIHAKDNTDRIRTRAMLCHIYHHALHDNWYKARDLMLMSHLQDTVHHSDVPTQILYNRAMVQLGLCAFKHGNIKDAHNALLDIQSGGRAKELLAQGLLLQRQHERSSEQEKIEKRRQMPFHMHINLELLECVYLVSAMLMEIPYMAAHEYDTRRRIISKSFNHQLKISDRQSLVGPPESMREHVVAAAKAMRNGNWLACRNYVINEKMNAKVWDLFHQADKVREMLSGKIQEETLRTYLFTYSSIYDSISMTTLSEMFKLDKNVVHGIISKMIINEELMVSLDEPSETVVMHRTEPTRLQSLALQMSDKLSALVENNERIYEMKQGSFFNRGQQNYQRQGGYGRQGGYQQGGRRQQQKQYN